MSTYAPIWGCNLGDTLWVTPLARYAPDLVVQMLANDARSRATAPILDGLPCRVEWVERTTETPKLKIHAHVTQQILAAYGYAGKPSVPRVMVTIDEILWAIEYLKGLGLDPTRTVAFTNHNSGSGDPTNHRAHYVRPPSEVIKTLARFWGGGTWKVAQFGPAPTYHDKDPFDPIPNAVQIRGLTVRQLAACYHIIGRFIGGDSGDYHLMLAVGGEAAVLVPPHSDAMGYRHWDLLYDDVCWGGERPRVQYVLHQDWVKFMNTKLFDSKPATQRFDR